MNQETLETLLDEWQKTLRLQDWDVVVRFSRIFDLSRVDILGDCSWVLPKKCANIRILDPADYATDCVRPFDPEQVLVHELVHLHFAPFCPLGEETDQHEQAVEMIAKALVTVKRSGAKAEPTPQ